MTKTNKPQVLKSFLVWIEYPDCERYTETISARTAAAARYRYYILMDSDTSYKDYFRHIKSKCIGNFRIEHVFGDIERFNKTRDYRNIPFAYQGMIIDVNGKKGWIVGSNGSMNLDVVFEGESLPQNCHPHWETTYYDNDMKVVKCYKKE